MKRLRLLFLLLMGFGIFGVILILIKEQIQPPFSRSLSPLFQEIGKPIKSIDRVISRVIPVDDIDEKMLGDEIKSRISKNSNIPTPEEQATVRYLNSLVGSLTKEAYKQFEYKVFLVNGPPNASALPGGVIYITNELIDLLDSEAELVAILSHEIGHIERGHLFDAAREEMLRKKIHNTTIISYASDVISLIASLTFSKAQEDEADEYGFRMLVKKGYDPFAMSYTFDKLLQEKIALSPSIKQRPTTPIDDFFNTHPYIELRREKFRSRAKLWVENYPNEKRYVGKKNLTNRKTSFELKYPDEWGS